MIMPIHAGHLTRFGVVLACAAALLVQPVAAAQQSFATPEAAVAALREALRKGDTKALIRIAGDEHKALVTTGEPMVDKENYTEATLRLNTFNALESVSDTERVLLVGAEAWPFPIPIVKGPNGWYFASARGEEELLNRRIGENELGALQVMAAYRDAQMLYAAADRDGDGVREYAQRLMSSPGKQDGLYWSADAEKGEAQSPWGPLIAASTINPDTKTPEDPYHGYRYRVLTRQGASAAGGAHDYLINGNMVAGYGLVAFPAEPDESGVMTFIVNRNGKIFQKPLGPDTVKIAAAMTEFDPGDGWMPVDP
jgi:hypothetical protein